MYESYEMYTSSSSSKPEIGQLPFDAAAMASLPPYRAERMRKFKAGLKATGMVSWPFLALGVLVAGCNYFGDIFFTWFLIGAFVIIVGFTLIACLAVTWQEQYEKFMEKGGK